MKKFALLALCVTLNIFAMETQKRKTPDPSSAEEIFKDLLDLDPNAHVSLPRNELRAIVPPIAHPPVLEPKTIQQLLLELFKIVGDTNRRIDESNTILIGLRADLNNLNQSVRAVNERLIAHEMRCTEKPACPPLQTAQIVPTLTTVVAQKSAPALLKKAAASHSKPPAIPLPFLDTPLLSTARAHAAKK